MQVGRFSHHYSERVQSLEESGGRLRQDWNETYLQRLANGYRFQGIFLPLPLRGIPLTFAGAL